MVFILSFESIVMRWMKLEPIIQSEVSQPCFFSLFCFPFRKLSSS